LGAVDDTHNGKECGANGGKVGEDVQFRESRIGGLRVVSEFDRGSDNKKHIWE